MTRAFRHVGHAVMVLTWMVLVTTGGCNIFERCTSSGEFVFHGLEVDPAAAPWMPDAGPEAVRVMLDCGGHGGGSSGAMLDRGQGASSSGSCVEVHTWAPVPLPAQTLSCAIGCDAGVLATCLVNPDDGVVTMHAVVPGPDTVRTLWDAEPAVVTQSALDQGELVLPAHDGVEAVRFKVNRPAGTCGELGRLRITPTEVVLADGPAGASTWAPDGTVPSVILSLDCAGQRADSTPAPGPRVRFESGFCLLPEADARAGALKASVHADFRTRTVSWKEATFSEVEAAGDGLPGINGVTHWRTRAIRTDRCYGPGPNP